MKLFKKNSATGKKGLPDDIPWDRLVDVAHSLMKMGYGAEEIKRLVGPVNGQRLQSRIWDSPASNDAVELSLPDEILDPMIDPIGFYGDDLLGDDLLQSRKSAWLMRHDPTELHAYDDQTRWGDDTPVDWLSSSSFDQWDQ